MTPSMDTSIAIRTARRQRLADLLHRSAERVPRKLAVVYGPIRLNYAELNDKVNRTANALRAQGVGRGDHIALLSHNNLGFVVTRFALARLGAVMVPINFMLNASEVAYILGNGEVCGIVAEDALTSVADAAIAEAGITVKVRGSIREKQDATPAGWDCMLSWMDHADNAMPDADVDDDDPVQMMYTSGTESRPKGVLLPARSLYAQYASVIIDGEMTSDDIEVHSLPLYHCAQLDCFLTPDLYLGATSIVLPAADPGTILKTIAAAKANKLFCPPTVWIALLRHPDFDNAKAQDLILNPDAIAVALAHLMPPNAIVCDESVTSGRDFFRTTHGAAPHDFLQLPGGAIGWLPRIRPWAAAAASPEVSIALPMPNAVPITSRTGHSIPARACGPVQQRNRIIAPAATIATTTSGRSPMIGSVPEDISAISPMRTAMAIHARSCRGVADPSSALTR